MYARLWSERSGQSLAGILCIGESNAGGLCYNGLASHPRGSRNTPGRFMLQKPG